MNVNLYEKIWMWGVSALIVLFLGSILASSLGRAIYPPSHVETINPTQARTDPRFASPRVTALADGSVQVTALAQIWTFVPREIRVPVGRPVTFRITSPDIIHGFQIVGTNVNTMVVPGYVSQLTTTFNRPGEYLILCNEYCGTGHHLMAGKLIVTQDAP